MTNNEMIRRRRRLLLGAAAALAAVAVFYILAKLGIGIPCLFHQITGLQCPGCGNSRAALALMGLDIKGALGYNLLFPLEFGYIGWVVFHCCRNYLRGKGFSYKPPVIGIDIGVLAAVLGWWVVRNVL
jgi:hypothetical protein